MYYSLSILQSMLPIKKCILICFTFLFVMGNDIIVDRSIVSVSFYLSLALCKSLVILVRGHKFIGLWLLSTTLLKQNLYHHHHHHHHYYYYN